jgi:hypothetical protein
MVTGDKYQRADQKQRSRAEGIFAKYFTWDFFDKPTVIIGTGDKNSEDEWVVALWDIRSRFGRDFTNKALLHAVSYMADIKSDTAYYNRFDSYFCFFFAGGALAIGSDEAFGTIRNIVKAHHLDPGYCAR